MKMFRNMCAGFGLAVALVGCTGGNGDFFSGHTGGTRDGPAVVKIGDYRITVATMFSARNFPIPDSRAIYFSLTPEAVAKRNRAKGLYPPADADWARQVALLKQSPHLTDEAIETVTARMRAGHEASEYKSIVRPDGRISTCSNLKSRVAVCKQDVSLTRATQMRLAQQVLDQVEPGCTLGQIDPPAVTNLLPRIYKSSERLLVAAVNCP